MKKSIQLPSYLSSPHIFTGLFILLIIFRVWLITGVPNLLQYFPHDDLFYVKAAHYLIHGQWLGPYSQMTLIKGPFYPFFIILSFLTGLPLLFNETVFYVIACIVLFYAFSPLIQSRWWRLLLFTLVLFSPASLITYHVIRVYRDLVYISLTMLVVAFSIGLFLRLDQKISTLLWWSIGLGMSMGAFMLTREEGIWIYPMLFLLLIGCLLFIWIRKMDQKISRSFLVLLPVLLWYIPIFAVSYLNYSNYGFWGVTETLDPDFNRVLNTLGRIRTNIWYPHVQVTKEALMKAYEVSPLLSDLRESIEATTPTWQAGSNAAILTNPDWYLQQYSDHGTEIAKGMFLWQMRDAVYMKGYYAAGKYPEIYKQLADQLESACKDGRLDCSPPTVMPSQGVVDQRHYPIIWRMFYESLFHILKQDGIGITSLDLNNAVWQVRHEDYIYFKEFIYNPLDYEEIHSTDGPRNLINGKTDLRIKVLSYKEKIMWEIFDIYKGFSLPASIAAFMVWIFFMFLSISNRQRGAHEPFLVISIFVLGLFFTRLMTLVIAVGGATAGYATSNYLFIYIFIFLLVYSCVDYLSTRLSNKTTLSQSDS